MNEPLLHAMQRYFEAGGRMDVDQLDSIYAEDFQNIRVDRAGRSIVFTKAQFMSRFRQMKAQAAVYEPSDDITYLATNEFDDHASLLLRRIKDGLPVLYNFVWRVREGKPTEIIREFTVEDDLSALIALVEDLKKRQFET
jgi:ketosteroid isomerase-like protein